MEKCGVHNSIIDYTHVDVCANGVFTHPRRRCRCAATVTGGGTDIIPVPVSDVTVKTLVSFARRKYRPD